MKSDIEKQKQADVLTKAVETLLRDKGFYCHTCEAHRKNTVIEGSKQKCPKCGAWLLEADIHFMRKLLRADWPLCEHCHRRFRYLDKHVARKHDKPVPAAEFF